MPGYYERRLRAIFDSGDPRHTTKVLDAEGKPIHERINVFVDNATKAWLARKAPIGWRTRYLSALFTVNPTLDCWLDMRPDHLRDADLPRLAAGHRPLWTEGTEPIEHIASFALSDAAKAVVELVSDSYGIVPQQYVANNKWEGISSRRLDSDATYPQKLTGVLRAIANGYLAPRFEPHLHMEPKVPRYGKLKKGAKSK